MRNTGNRLVIAACPDAALGLSLPAMTQSYVFDLDGTLVDTAPDLNFAINTLLTREGRREVALEEMKFLIGNGVGKLVERAFARTGASVDPERLKALIGDYVALYQAHQAERSRLYPGVVETLEKLEADDARLAVLTNKPHESATKLIAQFGLERFFPVVFGGGKRDWLKPDARLFFEVVAELGGEGPAVMIGDSLPDVETGRNAGVPVVLVTYGYCAVPPETLGADALVDRFADIPAAVERLIKP